MTNKHLLTLLALICFSNLCISQVLPPFPFPTQVGVGGWLGEGNRVPFQLPPSGYLDFGSRIALQSIANGRFVSANGLLIADSLFPSDWQKFELLHNYDDGTIALRSVANQKFVTAENAGYSPLVANRDWNREWERFYLIFNSDGTVSLKANANGRFVCAESAGASPLIANRDKIGPWESFQLTYLF